MLYFKYLPPQCQQMLAFQITLPKEWWCTLWMAPSCTWLITNKSKITRHTAFIVKWVITYITDILEFLESFSDPDDFKTETSSGFWLQWNAINKFDFQRMACSQRSRVSKKIQKGSWCHQTSSKVIDKNLKIQSLTFVYTNLLNKHYVNEGNLNWDIRS